MRSTASVRVVIALRCELLAVCKAYSITRASRFWLYACTDLRELTESPFFYVEAVSLFMTSESTESPQSNHYTHLYIHSLMKPNQKSEMFNQIKIHRSA